MLEYVRGTCVLCYVSGYEFANDHIVLLLKGSMFNSRVFFFFFYVLTRFGRARKFVNRIFFTVWSPKTAVSPSPSRLVDTQTHTSYIDPAMVTYTYTTRASLASRTIFIKVE